MINSRSLIQVSACAMSAEIAKLKKRLEHVKNGKGPSRTRVVHCSKCHQPRNALKMQVWVRGRPRHACTKKNICKSLQSCPALTEKKKEEFHQQEYLTAKIEELERLQKVHQLVQLS